jgi:hypothetical protein
MAQLPCFKGSWAIYPPIFFWHRWRNSRFWAIYFELRVIHHPNPAAGAHWTTPRSECRGSSLSSRQPCSTAAARWQAAQAVEKETRSGCSREVLRSCTVEVPDPWGFCRFFNGVLFHPAGDPCLVFWGVLGICLFGPPSVCQQKRLCVNWHNVISGYSMASGSKYSIYETFTAQNIPVGNRTWQWKSPFLDACFYWLKKCRLSMSMFHGWLLKGDQWPSQKKTWGLNHKKKSRPGTRPQKS